MGRRIFGRLLKRYYRNKQGNEQQRKKYFENELSTISQKINVNMNDRSVKVDEMLR